VPRRARRTGPDEADLAESGCPALDSLALIVYKC
jgi:hypothetical protein